MRRLIFACCIFSLALLLSACATWSPDYEKPEVNITSFSLAPQSSGLAPRFVIGLQVINPNSFALNPVGMSYSVEIEGHRVLVGAQSDLPQIPAYGQAEFTIQASPDLLGSVNLLNDLLSTQRDSLSYLVKAKIDIGRLLPYITIEEPGKFSLNKPSNTSL